MGEKEFKLPPPELLTIGFFDCELGNAHGEAILVPSAYCLVSSSWGISVPHLLADITSRAWLPDAPPSLPGGHSGRTKKVPN
jgi:hypothetical protein